MKALPVSIILFVILIFVISVNSVFVNQTAATIDRLATEIASSDDRGILLSELNEYWESRHSFLALSITTDMIDNVASTIICLNEAYEFSRENDIQKYSLILSDQANAIRRAERFTAESIL